ncbi:MAG TPA: hypothetical protein VGC76_12520 [Pyrinomonadaceae bacterium]
MKIKNNTFALLIETLHLQGSVKAITAIHRQKHSERQGGVRFVDRGGNIEELANLTKAMTEKCTASRLPIDALRSIIITPPGKLCDIEEKAAILVEHFRTVIEQDQGAVFGPDMRCAEDVLSRVAEHKDLLPHVTGLTKEIGGLEINKRGYTAFGLVHALSLALNGKIKSRSFSIQGFGSVGSRTARLIFESGGIIKAVSNSKHLLYSQNGLDIAQLYDLWEKWGNKCLPIYNDRNQSDDLLLSSQPEKIFEVPVDGFIPVARTSVLASPEELSLARRENPEARDVTQFLQKTGVKIIVEGANHPLTESAEFYLEDNGVIVLPDILVNCGGLIGTRLEWENRNLAVKPEQLSYLDDVCRSRIRETVEYNVLEVLNSKNHARRTVADIISKAQENRAH